MNTVIPPGGPRPGEQVHTVPPGHAVRRSPDGTYQIVESSKPEQEGGQDEMSEEFVITPGGVRRKSLVHQIEAGAVLDGTGGRHRMLHRSGEELADFGVIESKPGGEPLMPGNVTVPAGAGAVPALGSGWICYAAWNRVHTITSFSTKWVVPAAPATNNNQLFYMFNGIQSSTMIYQPVLQWGNNGAFGGNYWCVASWYADGQGGAAFHSNPVTVSTGQVLTGIMTLTNQTPQGFSYNCEFQGIANSGYPIQNVPELWQCVETLETYRMTRASDYPAGKTGMSSIDIRTQGTQDVVTWSLTDAISDVGQHVTLFDTDYLGHGEVDIWYGPAPYWTSGSGTVAAGARQDWWFSWGGTGDVGPQLIQAEPVSQSGELATIQMAEVLDTSGHLSYHATLDNTGGNAVQFQWRGGGR